MADLAAMLDDADDDVFWDEADDVAPVVKESAPSTRKANSSELWDGNVFEEGEIANRSNNKRSRGPGSGCYKPHRLSTIDPLCCRL